MTQMRTHARRRTYARYVPRTLQARILMASGWRYIDIRNRLARFSERVEHDATVGSKGIDNRYINVATSLARYSDEYRTSVSPANENVHVRRIKRTRAIQLIDTNGRTNCHVVDLTPKSSIKLYFHLHFNIIIYWRPLPGTKKQQL